MPEIDFGPEDMSVGASKEDRLRAVMLYPESAQDRSSYLRYRHALAGAGAWNASKLADAVIAYGRTILALEAMPIRSACDLVEQGIREANEYDCGPGAADFDGSWDAARNDEKRRIAKGRIAGDILILMLGPSFDATDSGLSLSKARYVIEKGWNSVPKEARECGVSEASIANCWKVYRSVSHYWAAEILAEGNDRYYGGDTDGESRRVALLEWGEALLRRAKESGILRAAEDAPSRGIIPIEVVWSSPFEGPGEPELLDIGYPHTNWGDLLEGYRKNLINRAGTGFAIRNALAAGKVERRGNL